MPNQISVPPPPNLSPITDQEANIEWKNWFSLFYEVLNAQRLLNRPAISPGGEGSDGSVYWHKVFDPAFMHLYFGETSVGNVVPAGGVIDNYDGKAVQDWQLVSSPLAGTVVVDNGTYPEEGIYHLSISVFASIGNNAQSVIGLYRDGVLTPLSLVLVTKSVDTTTAVFSGVIEITPGTYDLRVVSGATVTIYTISWSMHRISPIPEAG